MGLDGGTIISRSDVLRGASWRLASSDPQRSTRGGQVSQAYVAQQEAASSAEVSNARWSSCALTGEPLREPIATDDLGKLYNKESVVQLLLAKSGVFQDDAGRYRYENQLHFLGDFEHLRSLKNIYVLHPSYAPNENSRESTGNAAQSAAGRTSGKQGGASWQALAEHWVCPITALHVGGSHQFTALRPCGHCFSFRALRELTEPSCPICGTTYGPQDLITLNPTGDQLLEMRENLKRRQEAAKEKGSKRKRTSDRGKEAGDKEKLQKS